MDDKEMLELAAKAIGEKIEWLPVNDSLEPRLFDSNGSFLDWPYWNPLTDDGDNRRLEVALHINVNHNHPADNQHWVAAERSGCEGCYGPVCCIEDEFDECDRAAAVRLVVLRAAAEIGKNMEGNSHD